MNRGCPHATCGPMCAVVYYVFQKARFQYQQCMASFPAQTAKFSSNYVMFCHIKGVASLRITIKTHLTLATSAFFLAHAKQEILLDDDRW